MISLSFVWVGIFFYCLVIWIDVVVIMKAMVGGLLAGILGSTRK